MSEWAVVAVIITLFGFIVSVVKPIVSLTKSITSLTVEVTGLREDMKSQKKDVHESFTKVWAHEDKQDEKLSDHELRLGILESTKDDK